jgi:hypothetical protein
MHAVSGRDNCCPSFVNDAFVSPRPWRRIRMLVGGFEEGAIQCEKHEKKP